VILVNEEEEVREGRKNKKIRKIKTGKAPYILIPSNGTM